MKRVMLILFIGLELSYYLLIVQTGLVEFLHSDLLLIAPLPIGGVMGSLIVWFVQFKNRDKIGFFISLQLLISFFYPNLSAFMLFMLGISAGALAPLLINELKKAYLIDIACALGLSYSLGTALFNTAVANRGLLAIVLSVIILIASRFLPEKNVEESTGYGFSLFVMLSWIFLDSALFETLSRDALIPIWRLNLTAEIIFSHLLGIFLALYIKTSQRNQTLLVFILFGLSYLLYFLKEAEILAVIYPVVISYYNVLILQTMLQKELKTIAISMIFIAWIASGAGLMIALSHLIIIMPLLIMLFLIKETMQYNTSYKKEDTQCLKYFSYKI